MIFNFSTWRPATANVIIAKKTSMTSFLMPSNCLVLQYLQKHIQMKLAVADEQIAVGFSSMAIFASRPLYRGLFTERVDPHVPP